VDAILVQLPLPSGMDTDKVIKAVSPAKDIDGFHLENLRTGLITPPVFGAVEEILKSIKFKTENKKICIISNSEIFGDNLKKFLTNKKGGVEVCRVDDKNLINKTKNADILITAVGKPKFIKKEMIKTGAVIIDIGITKVENKFCGDVDFEDVKNKAGYITPVPGGVGPLTIAMALRNTLEVFKKNKLHQYIAPLS
jgi:methylenetetrahydrofolate dehydrogenase (NADP+)/methenyltetrahydrofolate cyclohydrolase